MSQPKVTEAMDAETLCDALTHTLNPDRTARQAAEAALKQVRAACRSLVGTPRARPEPRASRFTASLASWQSFSKFQPQKVRRASARSVQMRALRCAALFMPCAVRSRDAGVDPGVRQAGSIYFKNLVRHDWDTREEKVKFSDGTSPPPRHIGAALTGQLADEKAVVRENLLEVLVLAPGPVR